MPHPELGGPTKTAHLVALLEGAGIAKSSAIRIVGPHGLPALLWLCRHGYDDVGCLRVDSGLPHDDEPDALLIARTCGEIELKRILPIARQLRPDGALIFQLRSGPGVEPLAIDWLLRSAGFATEARFAGGRRTLFVARRHGLALRKAA